MRPLPIREFAATLALGPTLALVGCLGPRPSHSPAPRHGAIMPWTTHQAETARTDGGVEGPDRRPGTPAAEAVGRRHVRLDRAGQFVEFTLTAPADAVVVRHSLPDAPGGGGTRDTVQMYLNGRYAGRVDLDSRFAWVYGDFPWSNDPARGGPRRFWDEARARLEVSARAGDVLRLVWPGPAAPGAYVLLDLVETERVPPPARRPADALDLTAFGARPDDGADDAPALRRALEEARAARRPIWIPEGVFLLEGPRIPLGGVTVAGAGPWRTVLTGPAAKFEGTGEGFSMRDLAIFGDVAHRNDDSPDNAFNGNLGDGTTLFNLWVEHVKCGLWTLRGTTRLRVENCRFRNTMADGINLCDGTTDSTVIHSHFRNTGDDALASWSPTGDWSSRQPCERNRFLHNTIESPWLANGIALYGGTDHRVAGNHITGTVHSGGGLLVSSGFGAVPFAGEIRVEDNFVSDTGGDCYIGERVGALWIHAKDSDITARLRVRGLTVRGGSDAGVTLHGPRAIQDLRLEAVDIAGGAGPAVEAKASARGVATVSGLRFLPADRATPDLRATADCALRRE